MIALEAEQHLLGILTAYPTAFSHIDGLSAKHFSEEMHQTIFRAMVEKLADNGAISPVHLKPIIGEEAAKYLAKCLGFANSRGTTAARALSEEIIKAHHIRALLVRCDEAKALIQSDSPNLASAIAALHDVTNSAMDETEGRRFHDAAQVTLGIVADLENDVKPIPTKISSLDEAMGGGLYPGKAYGFAARKKVGKTILAGTISHNLNMAGVKHLFICGEMGEREIHQRVMGRHLGLYSSAFRGGYDRKLLAARLKTAARDMPKNAIYLDAPGITFERLKEAVGMAHLKYGISGFILDYWQLVGGKQGNGSEANHLQEVAQWIAEIGRKLGVWSITMAQINQDGNTRGSEGMRLAFDQVYQIHPVSGMGGEPDISNPGRWLEMMDTRYTRWTNIGSAECARLFLHERGVYFDENPEPPPEGYTGS
jgi:replicative DNA helicase